MVGGELVLLLLCVVVYYNHNKLYERNCVRLYFWSSLSQTYIVTTSVRIYSYIFGLPEKREREEEREREREKGGRVFFEYVHMQIIISCE